MAEYFRWCSKAVAVRWTTALMVLLVAACAWQDGKDSSVGVVTSDNDQRSYRYLTLPNQLQVLLISDPDSDKAAASLDVNVGSGADPDDYPGLAHFLEHMLFLGTGKYPEAGEYQAFISAHGGNHNAYTSFEHTNYFFDIDPDYLDPALDRFSQFFISPLFQSEYVEREKNAVHSEFMAKIKQDQRRSLNVFKTVINPKHPFSRFSVGNLTTLDETGKSVPLREQLLDFHARYYSANIMTLVVLGKQPLSELAQMVEQKFAAINNKEVVLDSIEEPLFSAQQYPLPLWVNIRPEKELRELTVLFPTADEAPFYREKPLSYIGNILGHEGEGSLFSMLKNKGWAERLAAGTGLSYRGGATFNVTIQLTPEGERHTDDIVAALFQTIRRIGATGDQQWLYNEQKALAEQGFRYQELASPIHYVMGVATNMHYYQPQDFLRGPYMMEHFDRALIGRFLDYLTPENCFITLSSPSVETDSVTDIYRAHYQARPIADAQLQRWQDVALNEAIQFPAPNPFVADKLALKSPQFNDREKALLQSDKPALIEEQAGFRLWYKPDGTFAVPRASIFVDLSSPAVAGQSADEIAKLAMLSELVTDSLNELSYPAALAGLSYAISPTLRGLSLQVSGFDDKQALLLGDILSSLRGAEFDPRRFQSIRREQIRELENAIKDQPYRRAFEQLSKLLYLQRPDNQQLLDAYRTLTLEQVYAFRSALLAQTDLKVLVHGNYRQVEAEAVADQVRTQLQDTPAQARPIAILNLIDQDQHVVPFKSDYSDAAMLLYVQGSDLSLKTRAALGLASQYMQSDFYTRLRTEKQLGYVVVSGAYPVRDTPGVFFLVQSPVAGAGALQQEIADYLQMATASVDGLSQQGFERQRDALILRLEEQPKNLLEQSGKYWEQIDQHHWSFDLRERLVRELQGLTLEDWRSLVKRELSPLKRSLWIFSPGTITAGAAVSGPVVDDASAWKKNQPVYLFP